jgi:hypothetical protein
MNGSSLNMGLIAVRKTIQRPVFHVPFTKTRLTSYEYGEPQGAPNLPVQAGKVNESGLSA